MFDYIMKNPILFYGIFAVICLIFLIILAVIINKVKIKKERKKLKKTSDSILVEHYEDNIDEEKSLEKAIAELEEKAEERNPEKVTTSFQRELDDITDNLNDKTNVEEKKAVVEEDITSSLNIESVLLKMKEDLTQKDEKQIYEFEKEQEENAIISYKELLEANGLTKKEMEGIKKADELFEDKPKHEYSDDLEIVDVDIIEEEPKNKDFDLNNELEEVKKSLIKEKPKKEDDSKKFKMTEFLSPVYGRIEDKLEYPTIPNLTKAKEQSIKNLKNEDFLNALKAFRENL